jgi:glucosamine-phosphate N-acetyltransferase
MSFKVDKFNFSVSNLKKDDFSLDYFNLLGQLSNIESDKITKNEFDLFIDNLTDNHIIKVIKCENNIIATITILKETKILHNFKKVGHIEDVVVDEYFRGYGLGKKLIEIAKNECVDCYKITLYCKDHNVSFYEKLGFVKNTNQMTLNKN